MIFFFFLFPEEVMPILSDDIVRSMSIVRFQTYVNSVDMDVERALALYIWNADIGSAFHLPIQAIEVSLRNSDALAERFGPRWWCHEQFTRLVNHKTRQVLQSAITSLRLKRQAFSTADVVSAMSLGFWVTLINKHPHLALKHFDLRYAQDAKVIAELAFSVLLLRNRIAHHEPIFRRDLLADYGIAMRLLQAICPATHDWIRPHCRVPSLVRQKP